MKGLLLHSPHIITHIHQVGRDGIIAAQGRVHGPGREFAAGASGPYAAVVKREISRMVVASGRILAVGATHVHGLAEGQVLLARAQRLVGSALVEARLHGQAQRLVGGQAIFEAQAHGVRGLVGLAAAVLA